MEAEIGQPITQLRGLFKSAAQAVVTSQARLSDAVPEPPEPTGGPAANPHAAHYSIPRADVSLSFGLEERNSRRRLIPFFRSKSNRLQRHAHELAFSVIAVPTAPPPPRGAPDEGEAEGAGRFPVTLIQPHFFVPLAEQKRLCLQLAEALEAGRWDVVYPEHGEKPKDKKVREEAKKIRDDIEPDDPARGMVVFALDTASPSFLVVRVSGGPGDDGLFVFAPGQEPEALIYTFKDDGIENIRYRALHEFALTVRHWLGGAPPRRWEFEGLEPSHTESPNGLGLLALSEFVAYMTEGYLSGLRFISAPDAPNAPTTPRVDLTGVRAELRYSVYYDGEGLRFSFGPRMRPDGARLLGDAPPGVPEGEDDAPPEEEELTVIESRTVIRATRDGQWPRVDVELTAPEFSLSGRARQFVIDAVAEAATDISKKLEPGDPDFYAPFLRGESYQRGAVILLSYEGNIPKQEFLAVWPGLYRERPRDFVFTCKLEKGKVAPDSVKLAMSLKQELDAGGGATGVELPKDKYEPFHNFFHGVRMWLSRTDKERIENRN